MERPSARDLFSRHHLTIFRFLRRMTGDAALAEDLTQDAFVRVIRGLETYQPRERDVAWLFRIARRLLLDHRRREAQVPLVVEGSDPDGHPSPFPQHLSMSLEEALRHLPDPDREAFLLREQGGLGYDEIADLTATTLDSVRNRIYRARRALREALAPTLVPSRSRVVKEVRS